jgi:predicted dithiol-disulfide oxidoreductase (DUF899 family)
MGWEMPWYSAQDSLDTLLAGRRVGTMYLICYLRQGSSVFETYWTTARGVEAMDNSYALLDMMVYGRQEEWEDSPTGCRNASTFSVPFGTPLVNTSNQAAIGTRSSDGMDVPPPSGLA